MAQETGDEPLLAAGKAKELDDIPRKKLPKITFNEWFANYWAPWDPKSESFWFGDGELPPKFIPNLFAFPNWCLLSHYFNCGLAMNLLTTPVE